ncbi:hypothetical protein CLAFUW4_05325 [Fulvia fulva]|uniref:MARVEL domain-containing protein n=1 Tax=Passalora fulva TaxID=5499 RepID=A0A9Q8LHY9_PASFU|nr:uncharacterized protein CLAFUR5_05473 [Fulvia fulva]KAK4624619.1 hypothetical protein CLAFUR4_05319 [Fulvia fulva]KAK4626024.1 hypothetical protein CLAFUR0_05327 [Fulvia fulva]UJO17710.1 hypothetical protein CLAFUR5_05473 [Fulvia fulva]WPV14745.1 hypothetical protein CLAFUW4_05325 [Fulvia fulva]WPV30215.1 hypothetical protein CLAFUW7_05324 [Fulvia fulva]
MAITDTLRSRASDSHGGLVGGILRGLLRFFQFVLALTVCGLYGVDLHHASQAPNGYADSKWVFAEVVAGLAAFTIILYASLGCCMPTLSEKLFGWDWVLFILWTAVFGLFGSIYIHADPSPEQHGQQRMKNAVWVDLVNMLLWLVSAIYATLIFFKGRHGRTMHTGRAKV